MLFVFDRFSHPALPAYIVAGLALGNLYSTQEVLNLTQIGLSFLVFVFGIKMDPSRLKSVAGDGLKTAGIQIVAVSALSVIVSRALGLTGFETFVFTATTSLSSTLVGLDLLEEEIDLNLAHGRLAESMHLSQDLMGLAALTILGASSYTMAAVSQSLVHGFGILVAALLFRRYLLDTLVALTDNSRELLMLTSITVLIGFLSLTELLQVSLAIGSFAAGLAVSKYPHKTDILDTVKPLKNFFSAIFFVSLGALLEPPSFQVIYISVSMLALTVLIKPFAVITPLVGLGQNKRTAYLTGFSIDQVSELALIIAIQAHITGTIGPAVFQSVIVTATVSMVVSSYTTKHGSRIYNLLSPYDHIPSFPQKISEKLRQERPSDHVIVLGYDTQGERIVQELKEENEDFVVIDNDPEKITDLEEKKENFVYGDVLDHETWENAGYRKAELIVSTAPITKVSDTVLELETDADTILRAEDVTEAKRLMDKGATYVSVPEILSSELLTDHIEGIMENQSYREDLRRKSMLELRRFIQDTEG